MTKKGDCVQTLKDFMDALKNREDGDYNPHCRRELEEDGIVEISSLPKNLSILMRNRPWRANSE